MKKQLVLFLYLAVCSTALSQSIVSNLTINIKERAANDSLPRFCTVNIEQNLVFEGYTTDTVNLQLNNVSMFMIAVKSFCFPHLAVEARAATEINYRPLSNFNFDGKTLSFVLPDPNSHVKIIYEHLALFNLAHLYAGALYFQAYMHDQQSWLFSCLGMRMDNAVFFVPEDCYLFVNKPYIKSDDTAIVNLSSARDIEFSFYVAKKDYYQCDTIADIFSTMYLYFLKDIAASSDSTYAIPIEKLNSVLVERKESLHTRTQKIADFFNSKEHKFFYIIDANLDNEGVVWGRMHRITKKDFLILMDTSMWNTTSVGHEIIHAYIPYEYNPPKNDSTHYFFNESIVEYLANYFFYEKQSLPTVYEDIIRKYYERENKITSIFKIDDNRIDASTGEGTARIVYLKTPYIIHKFAEMIGGDEYFVELLSEFYQQSFEKKQISLHDMEYFFRSKSVTNEQWSWFITNL